MVTPAAKSAKTTKQAAKTATKKASFTKGRPAEKAPAKRGGR
jgi:hypothetical protein